MWAKRLFQMRVSCFLYAVVLWLLSRRATSFASCIAPRRSISNKLGKHDIPLLKRTCQRLASPTCPLGIFASGPCSAEDVGRMYENVVTRLQVNPLLGYAAQHWGNHARKAFEQGFSIEYSILDFLRARGSVGSSVQAADILDPLRYYWDSAMLYTNISDLHIAAGFGLDKLARSLMDQRTDINVRDYLQWTPLHRAAAKGHDATVRLLLDQGADPRARDLCNSTALELAAVTRRDKVVQSLLEVESEVQTSNLQGISAFNGFGAAAEDGHVKVIQMFLKRLNPNERSGNIMGKLLHRAVLAGQERVVSLLLEESKRLEGFNLYTSQALGLAAYENNTSMMGVLLEAGAATDTIYLNPSHMRTASHMAAWVGHTA